MKFSAEGGATTEYKKLSDVPGDKIIELRTAVLWKKAVSVYTPDYCVCNLDDSPWIHQPFELYEGCDIEALEHGSPTQAAYAVAERR